MTSRSSTPWGGGKGLQVQGWLAGLVEFPGVDDDDFAVVAGQEWDESVAIGILQHQAHRAVLHGALDGHGRMVAAQEA